MRKITLLFLLISLQSCKPDDRYYKLSDEAKSFLPFEVNDTFKLKNLNTNEIITLTVISKETHFIDDGPNESFFLAFGPPADTYVERSEYRFTDNSNCYNGQVSVLADREGGYLLSAYVSGCFGNADYAYEYRDEFFPTIDVEGIQYPNAYLLRSFPNVIYYSKEKGILKIVDDYNDITLFSYVE